MNYIEKETDNALIRVDLKEEGIQWTDLMVDFINCLQCMGYSSDEFDEMKDKYLG